MLICDTVKKRRRRGPRALYVKEFSLQAYHKTVL